MAHKHFLLLWIGIVACGSSSGDEPSGSSGASGAGASTSGAGDEARSGATTPRSGSASNGSTSNGAPDCSLEGAAYQRLPGVGLLAYPKIVGDDIYYADENDVW